MIVDVTLPGYDPETHLTDHLVKWVQADSIEQVKAFLARHGIKVQSVHRTGHPDQPAKEAGDYGVDVLLEDDEEKWMEGQGPEAWKSLR